jgi:transposase
MEGTEGRLMSFKLSKEQAAEREAVALAYRELWRVEAIFRTAKSVPETRPVFHRSDAAIAGHLFCSLLALLLRKELDEQLTAAGVNAEWNDIAPEGLDAFAQGRL